MKRRILFVDDDPMVLARLRRVVRVMKESWDCHFALSGQEALIALDEYNFDVIVSDVLMPRMSGIQLLTTVKRFFPTVARVILTSQIDPEIAKACEQIAHQYLTKFCELDDIKSIIQEAILAKTEAESELLKKKVEELEHLPSLPTLYDKVMQELDSPTCSATRVAKLIVQDIGMTAKVLQLVNSASFGLRRQITSPKDAVVFVGAENLKALVLSMKCFSKVQLSSFPENFITELWEHSFLTGLQAKKIAAIRGGDKFFVDTAFSAGVLHDVGKLVLIADNFENYKAVLDKVHESKQFFSRVEEEMMGISHAEIGAHLLKSWELSDDLVEAVRYHHTPRMAPNKGFSPLTAVHIANVISGKKVFAGRGYKSIIDMEYLWELGLHNKIAEFEHACMNVDKNNI